LKKETKKFSYPVENEYLCTLKSETIIKYKEKNIMTKAEIVNSIVQRTGIGRGEVLATVEALMEEIRTSLAVKKRERVSSWIW
jgi:hypothetical protein